MTKEDYVSGRDMVRVLYSVHRLPVTHLQSILLRDVAWEVRYKIWVKLKSPRNSVGGAWEVGRAVLGGVLREFF